MLELPETVDTYNCSQCSHRTGSAFQLSNHVQRNHKNVYAAELFHAIVEPQQLPCICCDYKSYYQFELYEHCKQIHNLGIGTNENGTFCEQIERYPCNCCSYKSDSSLSLVNHQNLCGKEPTGEPQGTKPEGVESVESLDLDGATARITGDVGSVKSNILTHDSSHQCNHCSYRTNRKSNLREHVVCKHSANEEINWFECKDCSYRSKRKTDLKRHMTNKHAVEREIGPFQCNHCSYQAKQKSYLDRHMTARHTVHEEISWFECKNCSYRAKLLSSLNRHMKFRHAVNEEIDRYQCKHCSYRAKQKSSLKMHMIYKHAVNEEINWFQCNHCSYRAKQNSCLNRHMKLKHAVNEEIDWFQCHNCPHRTKQKSNLKTHMLKHVPKLAPKQINVTVSSRVVNRPELRRTY